MSEANTPSAPSAARMTVVQRIAFLGGQIGLMSLSRMFFQWILKFADQKPPGTAEGDTAVKTLFVASAVGAIFVAARVLDGIIDPLVGAWSDRWVARGRERRTLLLYTIFLAPLGLVLAFAPTHAMGEATRWLLLVAGFVVFFVGYGAYGIPMWSLVDDYGGSDPRERSILSNLLGAGILLAVAIGSVAVPKVIDSVGYGSTAIIIAGAGGALMVLPWFSKPRGSSERLADPSAHAGIDLRRMLSTLKNKRFLAVLLMFSGSQMALTIVSAAAPFVCVALLNGKEGDVASLMTPFLGTAIPAFALVPAFARKVGWEKAMVYASLALAAVYMGISLLGHSVVGSPLVTAMILFGFGGPAVAVLLGLESEAIANCARASGDGANVSLYFGMFNLGVKALNGVATFLLSLLVTLKDERPELAAWAARLMGILAGAMLFVGMALYFALRPKAVLAEKNS